MIRDWFGDIDHKLYDLFTEAWKLKKEVERMKPKVPEKMLDIAERQIDDTVARKAINHNREYLNKLIDCVEWLMERHGKDTKMTCDTCGWHYVWDEPTCPNCKRLREQELKYCCETFACNIERKKFKKKGIYWVIIESKHCMNFCPFCGKKL